MLIEKHPTENFQLEYYNSDGSQSLCGNGSRAAMQMAARLGVVSKIGTFQAYDGLHRAELISDQEIVRLQMNDVASIETRDQDLFLNTGSPHLIRFVNNLKDYPVVDEGREIRYSDDFKPKGTNVNFVELMDNNTIFVRTYERGVENETLSCGTGVTAAALASSLRGYHSPVSIVTPGGKLSVEFKSGHSGLDSVASNSQSSPFTDIFLIGPAKMVFEGDLEL
jgi:diaminopimelate epimerase